MSETSPPSQEPTNANSEFPLSEPNGTSVKERHMWQIFTDETGETQRKSVKITDNPFENIDRSNPFNNENADRSTNKSPTSTETPEGIPNGFANPNAYHAVPPMHPQQPPPKPNRSREITAAAATSNGHAYHPAAYNQTGYKKVDMTEDTVVFEADTTYTKFDTVDYHDDEMEIVTGDSSENHYTGKKFLIRSESDLDLVLPGAGKPSLATRLQWCCASYERWPRCKTYIKAISVALAMCTAYTVIVVLVVKIVG